MNQARVVVTGLGAVTLIGLGRPRILAGGVRRDRPA